MSPPSRALMAADVAEGPPAGGRRGHRRHHGNDGFRPSGRHLRGGRKPRRPRPRRRGHGRLGHAPPGMPGPFRRHRGRQFAQSGTLTSGSAPCWRPRFFTYKTPGLWSRSWLPDPSYLRSARDGSVVQYRDWGLPLGRRFRALRLWSLLRLEGARLSGPGLRRDLANAQRLAVMVEQAPGWHVVAPVKLQTVCVLHVPPGWRGRTSTLTPWRGARPSTPRVGPPDPCRGRRTLDREDLDRLGNHGVGRRRSHVAPDGADGGFILSRRATPRNRR